MVIRDLNGEPNDLMVFQQNDGDIQATIRRNTETAAPRSKHLRDTLKKKPFMKNDNLPPIIDVCCGGKMFYFDKDDPRVLFQDIRSFKDKDIYKGRTFSVEPDVVGDFTSMPYPDESFNMVVFDPPHIKYNPKAEKKGWQVEKYGWLPHGKWKEIISKGFAECFRILKPGGFLVFKWNETNIKVSEILKLTDQKPVFGHKSGKAAMTHWICFMKDINSKNYKL